MIVYLTPRARVRADDGRCFELQAMQTTTKGRNKGVERWVFVGYCKSLDDAARLALKKAVLDKPGVVTAQALIEALEGAAKIISASCEGAVSAAQSALLEGDFGPELPDDLFEGLETTPADEDEEAAEEAS